MYAKPDQYVTVYCKAPSHAGQPWIIATYVLGWDREGRTYWHNSRDQYLGGAFIRRANERHDTARVADVEREGGTARLIDTDSTEGRMRQMRAESEGRAIYTERLRCHLCGDGVKRTTANLHRDLDRLANRGESDVTLSAYRAAMR